MLAFPKTWNVSNVKWQFYACTGRRVKLPCVIDSRFWLIILLLVLIRCLMNKIMGKYPLQYMWKILSSLQWVYYLWFITSWWGKINKPIIFMRNVVTKFLHSPSNFYQFVLSKYFFLISIICVINMVDMFCVFMHQCTLLGMEDSSDCCRH